MPASAALIDAGVGEARHLADLDAELIDQHARLDTVLVTHGHRDHAGGAPAIAAAYPVRGRSQAPVAGGRRAVRDRVAIAEGRRADHRRRDETLTALHTPGHSPDHLAFWHEPTRAIFTGDLVVQGSSVMIHWSRGGDLGQYLASLERLLALEPRRLFPAHGPAIDDPRAILTQLSRASALPGAAGARTRCAPARQRWRRSPNPSMMVSRRR